MMAQEPTDEELAQARIKELAGDIKDEAQLKKILLTAKIGLRQGVYDQIKPHLKFSCRDYRQLMRHV
jgi:hypothetical protein